ncbi:MAG: flagellar biosynthetic protein FliO [Oligoflexia bacterium]|nr:flagellar biosynthetic protein FliO [Oligoflexia bacterium]
MGKGHLKTALGAAVLVLGALGPARPAFAVPTILKQVQVSGGSQIDLLFDTKVSRGQIKTEFFNDIIQLSLTDANVYPAKISSINGSSLIKIFAYQYAPKLVRCRITVRGKAESYKNRIKVSPSGKLLTIRFEPEPGFSDSLPLQASAPARVAAGTAGDPVAAQQAPRETPQITDAEERALLERVMSAQKPAEKDSAARGAGTVKEPDTQAQPIHLSGSKSVGGAKPLPSFGTVLLRLAGVLGLFGLVALLMRKTLGGKTGKLSAEELSGGGGMLGSLGRLAKGSLGRSFGSREKMIEVLSTHYLGPKKSIAVVRVGGRTLVLGVSNDSINLITQLGPNGAEATEDDPELGLGLEELGIRKPMGTGATSAGPAVFADLLSSASAKPAFSAPVAGRGTVTAASAPTGAPTGVRAQIRSRLEGLKPL